MKIAIFQEPLKNYLWEIKILLFFFSRKGKKIFVEKKIFEFDFWKEKKLYQFIVITLKYRQIIKKIRQTIRFLTFSKFCR